MLHVDGSEENGDAAPASLSEPIEVIEAPASSGDAVEQADEPPSLSTAEAVGLLETIGLWGEAKLVRESAREGSRRTLKRQGSIASSSCSPPGASPKPLDEVTPEVPAPHRKHFLVRALHMLKMCSNVEDAVDKLRLSSLTADEEALQRLCASSRLLAPALVELRQGAVDRSVLQALVRVDQDEEVKESDGESSANEFELGAPSSDEDMPKTHEAKKTSNPKSTRKPIVLPLGWHARRVQRGSREFREFVDPSGATFSSEAEVRPVVDAIRRAANMSETLRSQFRERLLKRQAAAEVDDKASEKRPRAA